MLTSENIISPLVLRERNLLPDDDVGVEELSCVNLRPEIPLVPELISSFAHGLIVQIPTLLFDAILNDCVSVVWLNISNRLPFDDP